MSQLFVPEKVSHTRVVDEHVLGQSFDRQRDG